MTILYTLTVDVLRESGLDQSSAESAAAAAWFAPDPVALARPFTHLPTLFGALRQNGVRVAIATIDDREPTEAMLKGLGIAEWVDTMVCADDGVPVKPAPDMAQVICERLSVKADRAVVVGDSVADLRMGKAAGAGLCVGVSAGVSAAEALAPYADVVIGSIAELV